MSQPLSDVQATPDTREISIDRVGVRGVKYPMTVRERGGGVQGSVGEFSLAVNLSKEFKGTHMSRFLEVLGDHNRDVSVDTIPEILTKLRERLGAQEAHLSVRFTLFIEKAAPVTGLRAMMGYRCGFIAASGSEADFWIEVVVPVTTLCPCSREIAERGAHNQRGYVTARLRPAAGPPTLWLEDAIEAIEAAASAPLYPLLKRPDEKWVTELAYDRPRFVEDMVREVALAFDADPRVRAYELEVENHESIHDHNAYAALRREKA